MDITPICERGGKLIHNIKVRIKTLEKELRKQAKKERQSHVLLFMSWGLLVALF